MHRSSLNCPNSNPFFLFTVLAHHIANPTLQMSCGGKTRGQLLLKKLPLVPGTTMINRLGTTMINRMH
jgi:hypothetical protein